MTYPVLVHTPTSAPLNSDHRLVVVGWKRPASVTEAEWARTKPATLCVSVPRTVVSVEPSVLTTAVSDAVEGMVNDYIRSRVVALKTDSERLSLVLAASDLAPQSLARWYASEGSPNRVTTAGLENWFDTDLSDALMLAFANKMGFSDSPTDNEVERLSLAVADHRKRLSKLAGPATRYPAPVASALLKAVALAADSDTKTKLTSRLSAMLVVQSDDILMSL